MTKNNKRHDYETSMIAANTTDPPIGGELGEAKHA